MYKGSCIHPQLNKIITEIGHTQMLSIVDAGFPIPLSQQRIDLAWKKGSPSWMEVCETIKNEINIEKIILTIELKDHQPKVYEKFSKLFENYDIEFVSHENFKKISHNSVALVRTGEYTSFNNCIFVAGTGF